MILSGLLFSPQPFEFHINMEDVHVNFPKQMTSPLPRAIMHIASKKTKNCKTSQEIRYEYCQNTV